MYLKRRGYDVVAATSGSDALDLLAGGTVAPDLLLTDIVMPGMNGVELAQAARQLSSSIRVLYMSGYTDHPAIRGKAGVEGPGFLQKPFGLDELDRTIRHALAPSL
ncbi:MAG TPA: response regulator [Gemmatimonadales bacterium]|nr:response regulator [Gemmatimonadales bacterium]